MFRNSKCDTNCDFASFRSDSPAAWLGIGGFAVAYSCWRSGFSIGLPLVLRGYIGGGDAKLLAAISIWTGFDGLYAYFLFVAIAGGILAFLLLGFRWFRLPNLFQRIAWLERLHSEKKHIPYGIAISSGAVIALSQTPSFYQRFFG